MSSALLFIAFCLVGAFIFSYLGDRQEGKSEEEAFKRAGKHISRQGPGLVVYIIIVFLIIGFFSLIFG